MISKGAWPRKLPWLLCFPHSENPPKSLVNVLMNYSSLLLEAFAVHLQMLCKLFFQTCNKMKTWNISRAKPLLSRPGFLLKREDQLACSHYSQQKKAYFSLSWRPSRESAHTIHHCGKCTRLTKDRAPRPSCWVVQVQQLPCATWLLSHLQMTVGRQRRRSSTNGDHQDCIWPQIIFN